MEGPPAKAADKSNGKGELGLVSEPLQLQLTDCDIQLVVVKTDCHLEIVLNVQKTRSLEEELPPTSE